jgi:hypothetical protein
MNTQNEFICILRIHGMNHYVHWEYVEWGKSSNGFLLCVFTEYANKSACILRLCGTNLYVYWEYTEFTRNQISWQIRNWNQNMCRHLSWAQMDLFGQTTFNKKIYRASVPASLKGLWQVMFHFWFFTWKILPEPIVLDNLKSMCFYSKSTHSEPVLFLPKASASFSKCGVGRFVKFWRWQCWLAARFTALVAGLWTGEMGRFIRLLSASQVSYQYFA